MKAVIIISTFLLDSIKSIVKYKQNSYCFCIVTGDSLYTNMWPTEYQISYYPIRHGRRHKTPELVAAVSNAGGLNFSYFSSYTTATQRSNQQNKVSNKSPFWSQSIVSSSRVWELNILLSAINVNEILLYVIVI